MMKTVCVMGLGYIGLPTAITFAKHGMKVHGVDVNPLVISKLTKGEIHIEEPGLQEMLDSVVLTKSLTFGTAPTTSDVYIISVPTPITSDKMADLSYVKSATIAILPYLKPGALVVLESTVPPRTVEDTLIPILSQSGLEIGEDLYVSHSPERVLPGKLLEELISNDRVIGGINDKSTEMTIELYSQFVKGRMHPTDATTAEMVKLMENTYRDVNIALANELAMIAQSIGFNVWEAINLANYHPRVNIHKPGPGVGGHCIAVDPWFIYEQAPSLAKIVGTSREINDQMPIYVAKLAKELLKETSTPKIAVLGLAFKGNVDDMRESPALTVIKELKDFSTVAVFDPHIKQEHTLKVETFEQCIENADILLILTDHDEFKALSPETVSRFMRTKIIFDTRNIINIKQWEESGFKVQLLGNSNISATKNKILFSSSSL
ncbi:nucleotide sugar dehydrogenase [Paenibacillus xylanexedens]|uniref:nucleotide sugar dehydrogenase n=1 Tax=Paenibacillus xylanexedens TaxID=528191 RepID=UPI00119CF1EC|nr:nucleotide sugar dehydrogenase [Paenibacillus xylanexedens]